ncbi:response regulator [Candidatus Dojkabacteria bacterium]|nr:response regulator [Candidatus Dojkabacteria bacterium]
MENIEILLVEDDANDAELALLTLRRNNILNKIHLVTDGQEALDFLHCQGKYSNRTDENKPQLILLDLKLPKINGLEVLKNIRENDNTKNIPVAIFTSSELDKDMIDGYKLGANSYIQKPLDFTQFSEAVKQAGLYWSLVQK